MATDTTAIIFIVILVIAAWSLFYFVLRPARELTKIAEALARGELKHRSRRQKAGLLKGVASALDTLTEQVELRVASLHEEQSRLSTILDSMVDAVFVTDSQGKIVLSNRALAQLIDVDAQGRSVMEAIRSPELHEAIERAPEQAIQEFDLKIALRDAETREFRVTVAVLEEVGGVVGVLHDITKERLADQIRQDFVANASHELRTPVTAIRGFAETLRESALKDPEASQRFVNIILKQTKRLEALVEDLSSLSRAESTEQSYERETIALQDRIREVIEGLEAPFQHKHLKLVVEGPSVQALADPKALDQILINLVDNAIKYTPEQGQIRVSTFIEDAEVGLSIENTGPGISRSHQQRIFERFYRVDPSRSREIGGTGLGLAIVKHLLANIGGRIEVESEEGLYTRFKLWLPRA